MTDSPTLWQIRDAINSAIERGVNDDGEITEQCIATLNQLEFARDRKIEGCHVVANELHESERKLRDLSERYEKLARAAKKRKERLNTYVLECLQAMGAQRVTTPTCTACVETTPGCVELADGYPIDLVPEDYVVTERKLDAKKLGAVMKAGAVFTFARLVRKPYLRWR